MTKKELTFNYFKENPRVLDERENAQHYRYLGIKSSTYLEYKKEYKAILQAKEASLLKLRDPKKYFKGRLRQKFIFNDNKLFS